MPRREASKTDTQDRLIQDLRAGLLEGLAQAGAGETIDGPRAIQDAFEQALAIRD